MSRLELNMVPFVTAEILWTNTNCVLERNVKDDLTARPIRHPGAANKANPLRQIAKESSPFQKEISDDPPIKEIILDGKNLDFQMIFEIAKSKSRVTISLRLGRDSQKIRHILA